MRHCGGAELTTPNIGIGPSAAFRAKSRIGLVAGDAVLS